jgi:brefeldin A-inhibited guanine nucleotide-exchange protein
MVRTQRKGSKGPDQFFSASHFVHVRPMFEVAWIPFLAGLSGPLQETDDLEVVELCLDGFKNAIKIVCFFDLELQRNAFVTTLGKFTFLNNLGEMKTKNMEAIKTLLDVAVNEGNNLKGSWHEILTCVSQLEHMQLISNGVDVVESGKKGLVRHLYLPLTLHILMPNIVVVLAKSQPKNSRMRVDRPTSQLQRIWSFL